QGRPRTDCAARGEPGAAPAAPERRPAGDSEERGSYPGYVGVRSYLYDRDVVRARDAEFRHDDLEEARTVRRLSFVWIDRGGKSHRTIEGSERQIHHAIRSIKTRTRIRLAAHTQER